MSNGRRGICQLINSLLLEDGSARIGHEVGRIHVRSFISLMSVWESYRYFYGKGDPNFPKDLPLISPVEIDGEAFPSVKISFPIYDRGRCVEWREIPVVSTDNGFDFIESLCLTVDKEGKVLTRGY